MNEDVETGRLSRFIAHEGPENGDVVVLAVAPVQAQGDEDKHHGRNAQPDQPAKAAVAVAHAFSLRNQGM